MNFQGEYDVQDVPRALRTIVDRSVALHRRTGRTACPFACRMGIASDRLAMVMNEARDWGNEVRLGAVRRYCEASFDLGGAVLAQLGHCLSLLAEDRRALAWASLNRALHGLGLERLPDPAAWATLPKPEAEAAVAGLLRGAHQARELLLRMQNHGFLGEVSDDDAMYSDLEEDEGGEAAPKKQRKE